MQTLGRVGRKLAGPAVGVGWEAALAGRRQLDQGHSIPYALGAAGVESVNQMLWGIPAIVSKHIVAHPEARLHVEK